jgi:hypothetical protein
VAVFINGESRVDRRTLSTPVPDVSEVHLKAFPGLPIRIVLTNPRDGAGYAAVQAGRLSGGFGAVPEALDWSPSPDTGFIRR